MNQPATPQTIYADYNGSAPLCKEVVEYLIHRLQNGPFANPNAIHRLGTKTLMGMENARALCAKLLGAKPKQLIFNSGATEGISQVFHSHLLDAQAEGKNVVIISGIEHSAVINLGRFYEERGYKLLITPVDEQGVIKLDVLSQWLKEHGQAVGLVSIMAANNETGVVQPYKAIAELCRAHEVPFLCDTTQFIGKTHFNFNESGVDYAVLSGHKIGAMTGAGILIARDLTKLKPMIIGGGQEKSLRGGTQNYIANETLAVALDAFEKKKARLDELRAARDQFEQTIKERFPEVVIIGSGTQRLDTTTYISYPGLHGQAVQIELESRGIFVTTSSACSDNEPATSKVLKAMGIDDRVGRGVVRISLGLCAPLDLYPTITEALTQAYTKLIPLNQG
jgi:cysteine desulfurase